jgi:hypothetical protein
VRNRGKKTKEERLNVFPALEYFPGNQSFRRVAPGKNSGESNFRSQAAVFGPNHGIFCPFTVFPNGRATWDNNLIRALRALRPHSVQPDKSGFPVFVKKLP